MHFTVTARSPYRNREFKKNRVVISGWLSSLQNWICCNLQTLACSCDANSTGFYCFNTNNYKPFNRDNFLPNV